MKFNSQWTDEKVKELVTLHRGKSHSETARALSEKWGVEVTRDSIKNKYNSISQGFTVNKGDKKTIEPLKNRDFFNRAHSDEGKKGKRVYFVTAAIAGGNLHKDFYAAIKVFLKDRSAQLVCFPMKGAQSKNEEYTEEVLSNIGDSVFTEYIFNSNLAGFDLELSPTSVSPLNGIQRASEKSSIIVASSKQDLKTIAVSTVGLPHILVSTGSLTIPNYGTNKISVLAEEDNVLGGLIVEIEDDKIFHIRQVQAIDNGSFYDLDKRYTAKGIEKARAEVFVLGDLHAGSEAPSAIHAFKEVMKQTNPKIVAIHDAMDSGSINHHQKFNMYAKITRPEVYRTLENELNNLVETVRTWSTEFPKSMFYIVKSNHDEFLERYIDCGDFIFDTVNYRIALDMAVYRADGLNPLEKYVESKLGKVPNFRWLKRGEEIKIADCIISSHGDKGSNGSKGTLQGTEKAYINSISGHSHSPEICRQSWQVGTCTRFDLPYTIGAASSWLHASCLLYDTSQKQLVISIDGKWKI